MAVYFNYGQVTVLFLHLFLHTFGTFGENIVFESVVARNNLHVFAWMSSILPDEWEARVDAALLKDSIRNKSGGSNAEPN